MQTTQYFPAESFLKHKLAAEPGRFIAHETAPACPFDQLEGLRAADAEEGGLAKLLTVRLEDGPVVAVKRFHATRELDEALFAQHQKVAREEYERMLELDGAGGHAPLAYAFGVCFDDRGCEHPAIAMEFVDGFTLEYALKAGLISGTARKADKTRSILEVGLHVARALAACKQVSHRDLNPRNVMLVMDRWGNVRRAVLIDFGQAIASANPLVTPSAEPHRLATVSFGAPEVYGGPFYFMRNNPSVDVYSLGTLLYYLRTRSIPFLDASTHDPTTQEGARFIVDAKRTPVSIGGELGSSLRAIDQRLHDLAADCTAFDPRERPSVEELIARMEAVLGESDLCAGAASGGASGGSGACSEDASAGGGAGASFCGNGDENDSPSDSHANGSYAAAASASAANAGAGANAAAPSSEQLLRLADDYFYGHGGKTRSKQRSLSHLIQAAKAGSAAAQLKLGRSYALGQHGVADIAKAHYWLEQAKLSGHPGAGATLKTFSELGFAS